MVLTMNNLYGTDWQEHALLPYAWFRAGADMFYRGFTSKDMILSVS
jgi:hypothetical protein